MPRWRKLHVKSRQSLDINEMPDDFTRLLWVLLPLGLDREGRGLDNASWVKAQLMPLRTDVTLEMVSDALKWYENKIDPETNHGMIVRYKVNGRAYFWVPTFPDYQGDTSREAESEFPPPSGMDESKPAQESVTRESRPIPEPVATTSSSDADATTDSTTEAEEIATEIEPPLPKPRKRRSRADPRTKHPAIQAIKTITGRLPAKILYDRIIALLGEEPAEDKLRRCFEEWAMRGFKITNFAWLFEWYVSGIPPKRGRSSSALSIEDEWLAEQGDGK